MHFPDKLNIQSVIYTIKYFKSKKEVDIEQKKRSLRFGDLGR